MLVSFSKGKGSLGRESLLSKTLIFLIFLIGHDLTANINHANQKNQKNHTNHS
jgi:hypothetical protein